MAEKEIIYGEKIIKFPDEVMTVTIPKDVFVEVKEMGSEGDYKSDQKDFELIRLIINIAFFVCEENERKYVGGLEPKAVIRIRYDNKIVGGAKEKEKAEKDLKLGWWNGSIWVVFPNQKLGRGYVDVETEGWYKDPPVGWGC